MPEYEYADDELDRIIELPGKIGQVVDLEGYLSAQEASHYLPRTLKDFLEMLRIRLAEMPPRVVEPLDLG